MKKVILFYLFCLFFTGLSYSQENKKINCIIFVNNHLVDVEDGHFTHVDSNGSEVKIKFKYVYGEIRLSELDYQYISSLNPWDSLLLSFKYYYDRSVTKQKDYSITRYDFEDYIDIFSFRTDYLLIKINNNKKGYCVSYITNGISRYFCRKARADFKMIKSHTGVNFQRRTE